MKRIKQGLAHAGQTGFFWQCSVALVWMMFFYGCAHAMG